MLRIDKISKRYPGFALNDVSFSVGRGDYFILLGQSGAGKSMILEIIAGLVKPDAGSVYLDEADITHEKIQNRKVGLVFQDYAVFPHLSVKENIAYSLHGKKLSHKEKHDKVLSVSSMLGISGLLKRKPGTLSGGELQRVALARTLIQQPSVLLLDEPLVSLDSMIKTELRSLLRQIHRNGQTILHVTHDYEEALSLGTKIAVINNGSIVQEGSPEEVFRSPKSEFVAHFVGIRNFFRTELKRTHEGCFAVVDERIRFRVETDEQEGPGWMILRAEDVFLSKEAVQSSALNNFSGTVTEIAPAIKGIDVIIDTGIRIHAIVTEESIRTIGIKEGSELWVHFKATAARFISA
jgi:molybdopterin-binding protein